MYIIYVYSICIYICVYVWLVPHVNLSLNFAFIWLWFVTQLQLSDLNFCSLLFCARGLFSARSRAGGRFYMLCGLSCSDPFPVRRLFPQPGCVVCGGAHEAYKFFCAGGPGVCVVHGVNWVQAEREAGKGEGVTWVRLERRMYKHIYNTL